MTSSRSSAYRGIDPESGSSGGVAAAQGTFTFPQIAEWRDAIYAKIVQKVGDRRYWETWAKDVFRDCWAPHGSGSRRCSTARL